MYDVIEQFCCRFIFEDQHQILFVISAALFEPKHEGLVLAMQNAVTKVNMRQLVGRGRNLLVDLEYVDPDKSFDANRKGKVCQKYRYKN